MTETATTDDATAQPDRQSDADRPTAGDNGRSIRTYLGYALLAGLSLLALVAALQFYVNASAAIDQWVADEYRSLFQAAFNLVVLLVAAAGIAWQAGRLGGGR